MITTKPERWFVAFAASFFVFHQLPAFAGEPAGDVIDVFTPIAIAATSAGMLVAFGLPRRASILGFVGLLLYVHGHGVHLSANSIHNADPTGHALHVAYFWDEHFGHIEAWLGWMGLVVAFCLAERDTEPRDMHRGVLVAAALLLGWTFFTSTVEGQTWELQLVAVAVFVIWALRVRAGGGRARVLLDTAAAAYVISALLTGVWAIWQGGVPQFSDVGFI